MPMNGNFYNNAAIEKLTQERMNTIQVQRERQKVVECVPTETQYRYLPCAICIGGIS